MHMLYSAIRSRLISRLPVSGPAQGLSSRIFQVESTLAVQALAPSVKELQAKHANDPERLQLETAKLYKEANVNPLSGCLPTLATIPVFIGLYRYESLLIHVSAWLRMSAHSFCVTSLLLCLGCTMG